MFKQIMRHAFFFLANNDAWFGCLIKKNYAWLSGLRNRDILPEMSFGKKKTNTH